LSQAVATPLFVPVLKPSIAYIKARTLFKVAFVQSYVKVLFEEVGKNGSDARFLLSWLVRVEASLWMCAKRMNRLQAVPSVLHK